MLSYFLAIIVFVYTVIYTIVRIKPIIHFKKAEKNNELKITEGCVNKKINEEKKAYKGEMIYVCFPKYEYELNNEKKYIQSLIQYHNVSIGQKVQIGYNERTNEAWALQDIPLMKKNLIIRVSIIMSLLTVLIISEML